MSGNLLSIGKSGLFAAQAGLATTGNNITNANVAGYSRQVVIQATTASLATNAGFMGTGTKIAQIKRYSDEFLNAQVRTAQASTAGFDSYHTQIKQIDNLLADQTAGLSPTLQGFFRGIQDMASNRASVASRQSMLSAAQTMAARFQSLNGRLEELKAGVNTQIESHVTVVNTYASEIAKLNDQISKYGTQERAPNDLLDRRDQLVLELNKHVKANVTPGDNNTIRVTIGNGQPLVMGDQAYQLAAVKSPTDQTRVEVGYATGNGQVSILPSGALGGGELGGILDFRKNSLDSAQSALGKIAIGMAIEFNKQHKLGLDMEGKPGAAFFAESQAFVGKNVNNGTSSTTDVTAKVTDPSKLVDSDYKVEFDGTYYNVIRLSDNKPTRIDPYDPAGTTQVVDGVEFTISGLAQAKDNFLVRPTVNGAGDFKVLASDVSQIAAAAPIVGNVPTSNKGSGKITEVKVGDNFLAGPPPLPVTLSFDSASGDLTGFPAGFPVSVVDSSGKDITPIPPATVKFVAGATYTFGGASVTLGGAPGNGDTFEIKSNVSGANGDTRNIELLGALQTKNIFNNNSATFQSSYAQLVSSVGNKTREVEVNAEAGYALLAQVEGAALDVSGVNLDEEATNLVKYQQSYQAAGKVMQIAGTIFDTLLSIG
ncbi:flagellar hook-associated protein FlgK [Massilia niastensis]|uniref:flagellar hook-associated protein FlgK n=1 Tax=Massilia niastensis TaxID=544911 RepID=UPI000364A6C4|nr:flagellar hook-associated protein FlgK [Massilia niastensis]